MNRVATVVRLSGGHTKTERLEAARRSLADIENTIGVQPVSNNLRGQVWHVSGGNEQLFRALASVQNTGQWIGFAGLPYPGWCAAQEAGIDLRRVLVVEEVDPYPARVLATLIDGLDIVVCGDSGLERRHYRSLGGRARSRGCLVITTHPWIGVSKPWLRGNVRHLEAV
ncbi:MAG: hypothetical protein Q4P71_04775 [Actinomycetaceae bacterium]|nr:hypothetical protein [Actinomycetaceae bacterium]